MSEISRVTVTRVRYCNSRCPIRTFPCPVRTFSPVYLYTQYRKKETNTRCARHETDVCRRDLTGWKTRAPTQRAFSFRVTRHRSPRQEGLCGSAGRMPDGARSFAKSPGRSAAARRAAILSRHAAAIRPNSAVASSTAAVSQLLGSASAPTLCSRTTATSTNMLCAAHASSAAMSPATGARVAADAVARTPPPRSVDASRRAAPGRVASAPQRRDELGATLRLEPRAAMHTSAGARVHTPRPPHSQALSSNPGTLAHSRTHMAA